MAIDVEFSDRTPQGIAGVLARLISEGVLAPGDRLPTVRDIAADLAVSPATVSAAWQALTRTGLIVSRGRAGTFVRTTRRDWLTPRVQGLSARGESTGFDLSLGTPDPLLLPPLGPVFARVTPRAETGRYHDLPVLPELAAVLQGTWPVPAESITVVDGALDGISRVLEQIVKFGDRVVVESPGFPYFFDLVEALGGEAVTVELDEEGIVPRSLAHSLALRPAAVIIQPRAQNPTGASMTAERAGALADVIGAARDGERIVIVEDDHSGAISMAPDVTLATWLPEQVVHVRSYSKSHGPDLRIAAVGGPTWLIERVIARRMLGPGWTSRLLQNVLWELLTDDDSARAVARARLTYRDRVAAVVRALARQGIDVPTPDGVNLWLPVLQERAALVHLAAAGIAVAGGSSFVAARGSSGDFVRVTAGLVAEGADAVAAELAAASRAVPV
ncbi:DNA-binding transcriptional MocR family regulator [Microbacterium endophyticum]|uniref:DNA-binding transcriptional MocR family regulator n=1 Tax=Microbacterium endophyticum TaxID=1526412 RepID=A0A7W4YN71_9MICO|nr:aminotransferase class I/II-fold pyridoxal phosphate-dependent enzyme [Microbacterium endophyticum]MBB2975401.1 DNA-binding transcriptional MocR family regulator [Microbacterium endophyticum]NIK35580.1 DNA-binding transcriptional MocR family regulator [Microbacterium endophyticum]